MPSWSLACVSIHHPQRASKQHPPPSRSSAQSPSTPHFATPPLRFEPLLHTLSCGKRPRGQALVPGTIARTAPGGAESRIWLIRGRHHQERGEPRLQLSRLLKKLNVGNYVGARVAGRDAGAVVSILVPPFEHCSCGPGNLKISGRGMKGRR